MPGWKQPTPVEASLVRDHPDDLVALVCLQFGRKQRRACVHLQPRWRQGTVADSQYDIDEEVLIG